MNRTLVIGVGGTGLDTLRALRKRLVASDKTKRGIEDWPQVGFLYVDTDPAAVQENDENLKSWEFLGVNLSLARDEQVIIQRSASDQIARDIDAYPQIKWWFDIDKLEQMAGQGTPGASQIRPLGRLLFTLRANDVKEKVQEKLRKIQQASGGGETHVYLVCSLSGGTGSGMFLDLSYRIRSWEPSAKVFGFLVMPDLSANRGDRYLPNAYAALLELNHFNMLNPKRMWRGDEKHYGFVLPEDFSLPQKDREKRMPPFTNCYLVSRQNENRVDIPLSSLPDLIAHKIYLSLDSSSAGKAASILNNAEAERNTPTRDPATGRTLSHNFSTFGVSAIEYPVEEVTEILSWVIVSDVFHDWLSMREIPGNVNERVQGYLQELKLTDEYLLGNRDFFGQRHFEPFEREAIAFVSCLTSKVRLKEKGNVAIVNQQEREFREAGFRGVGVVKYFQDRHSNLDGAVQEILKVLRARVSAILMDPELGYAFAQNFLSELSRILEAKRKVYVEKVNALPNKEKNTRSTLQSYLNQLTQAENETFFAQRKVQEAYSRVSEALQENLKDSIGQRAYALGEAVLARVVDLLKGLRMELEDWYDGMKKLASTVEDNAKKWEAELAQKSSGRAHFNGHMLFEGGGMKEVRETLKLNVGKDAVQSRLLEALPGGALDVPRAGDVLGDVAYKAAIEFLREKSSLRIGERNVADQLMENQPDAGKRHKIISETFNKSAPFLVCDSQEISRGLGTSAHFKEGAQTRAKVAGMLSEKKPEGGIVENVERIRDEIGRATGLNVSEEITDILPRHQILFLQERCAFPLRVLSDVKLLREHYRRYVRDADLPLHIQKSFDPPLGDLFLLSGEEISVFEKTEEAFVIARTEGKLRLERNKKDEVNEVRHRFMEKGTESYVTFGASWERAMDYLLGDDREVETHRMRLTRDVDQFVKTLDTAAKRRPLAARLLGLLDTLRKTLDLGEEDPVYRRYQVIRNRIVDRYKLPVEGVTAAPPWEIDGKAEVDAGQGASAGEPSTDAEKKYCDMARYGLVSSNGKLTSAMEGMLRSTQKRLGIPGSRAGELVEWVKQQFAEPEQIAEYRQMFGVFFEDGEITGDERAILIERQVELGLPEEQVKAIESAVMSRRASGNLTEETRKS